MLTGSGSVGAQPADTESVRVSLVQLIATPERFEGRKVVLRGFCRWGFEERAVYLHREDAELMNTANALWLDADAAQNKDLDGRFVYVSGVFTGKSHGHLGAFPGEIRDIAQLGRAPTRDELRRGSVRPPREPGKKQ